MSRQRIDTSTEFSASSNGVSIYVASGSASFPALSVFDGVSNIIEISSTGLASVQEIEVSGGVILGTHTVGNYVGSITDGTGVSSTALPNTTVSIGQAVGTSDSPTFASLETAANAIINGNLTVAGSYTRIETSTVSINDNIVVINNDHSGSPTEDAGIEIERGTLANVSIIWNESTDQWEYTNDGSSFSQIPTESSLSSLSGVSISSPQVNDVLTYSGSAWVNQAAATSGFSAGTMLMYVSDTPPDGWLLCDGSQVSQSTYADLYAEISTIYNDGTESVGNFRLPNFYYAVSTGSASAGMPENKNTLSNSSAHNHTLSISSEDFSHLHSNANIAAVAIPAHTHNITTGSGGDDAHSHPGSNSVSASGDMPHGHGGNYGSENASHQHSSGQALTNSSGTGGTHPARHNPPNTLRSSGNASANHSHPTIATTFGVANANHDHNAGTGNANNTYHEHGVTIPASNTGSHPFNSSAVTHTHGTYTISPDSPAAHSHTGSTGAQTADHSHSLTTVPVYYIIKY